jgi:hypothetical protein
VSVAYAALPTLFGSLPSSVFSLPGFAEPTFTEPTFTLICFGLASAF